MKSVYGMKLERRNLDPTVINHTFIKLGIIITIIICCIYVQTNIILQIQHNIIDDDVANYSILTKHELFHMYIVAYMESFL
jgi:hypothetical protein